MIYVLPYLILMNPIKFFAKADVKQTTEEPKNTIQFWFSQMLVGFKRTFDELLKYDQ